LTFLLLCCVGSSFGANSTVYKALQLNSSVYSETRAKLFFQFSRAAYCSETQINSWKCKPCADADPTFRGKTFTNSRQETQAFVGSSTGNIVVAFRGSTNIPNWIDNLNFAKKKEYPKCSGCEVHGGFYDAWTSVQDNVVAAVKSEVKSQPSAKIFVTGHSLGAAMAVLAAAELHYTQGYPIEAVYTYGEPRVGNTAFKNFYNQGTHLSWRVTHWQDPVPHLPLQIMGFTHIVTEVFYTEDSSSYKVCDSSGEDKSCSDQFPLTTNIQDHTSYFNSAIGLDVC